MVTKVLKLLCVFFLSVTVMLCGCGKNSGATLCADFRADFTAHYKGLTLAGQIVNTRQGVESLDIDSPDTLSGLSLSYRSGDIKLNRGDAAATADESYLPGRSFPSLLREILANIAAGNYSIKENNTYSQSVSCGECVFTVDENGLPQSIEAGKDFSVKFINLKKTGE